MGILLGKRFSPSSRSRRPLNHGCLAERGEMTRSMSRSMKSDEGRGDRDEVQGSCAAGAETYRAPPKRGKSKNGRDNAPQIVVGLAVFHGLLGRLSRAGDWRVVCPLLLLSSGADMSTRKALYGILPALPLGSVARFCSRNLG